MELINLQIHGYKCFKDASLEINNLTVLTGANSSGKSSVIQSLLLAKASEENNVVDLSNRKYAFDMGDMDSLINKDAGDEVFFLIGSKKYYFKVSNDTPVGKLLMFSNNQELFFDFPVFYLSAERQGPRFDIKADDEISADCGCHGQHTANAIYNNQFSEIDMQRSKVKGKFPIQLDNWLSFIFPEVSIKVRPSGESRRQISIRHNQVLSATPNVGFGISYSLPIIVEGLLADKNSWLIIENPEAHLHAKAQSNMGFFLAKIAAAGIRVIIETHSEHIVNGIRRAVVGSDIQLKASDVNIYFMSPLVAGSPQKILIDERGNLSDFPVDFFDQSRQDLLEIVSHN